MLLRRRSFRLAATLILLSASAPMLAWGQGAPPPGTAMTPGAGMPGTGMPGAGMPSAGATAMPGANIPPPPPPGGAPSGGQTAPPPTQVQLATSLVGLWRGQGIDGGVPVSVQMLITGEGQFQQWTVFPNGFTVQIWGTYAVTPITPTSASVLISPAGWQPTQFCGSTTGGCMPLTYQQTTTQVTILDANTIQNSLGTMRRVQQ